MNVFALRVCRHCRKPVGFDDTVCKHCKKKLMNPAGYKAIFFTMIAVIIIVYGSLFFAYMSLQQAYAATCPKSFYTREEVAQGTTCDQVCAESCSAKNAGNGTGIAITTGYNANSLSMTISCNCDCTSCVA